MVILFVLPRRLWFFYSSGINYISSECCVTNDRPEEREGFELRHLPEYILLYLEKVENAVEPDSPRVAENPDFH
jgi:hypothetical protein